VLRYRLDHLDVAADRRAAAQRLLDLVGSEGIAALGGPASTVHVSTVDADGCACAVTASSGYGSGVMTPGTGLWLNNCLGEPELNRRGMYSLPPGERLASNMAPTVGRTAGGGVLAIGSPGADRICPGRRTHAARPRCTSVASARPCAAPTGRCPPRPTPGARAAPRPRRIPPPHPSDHARMHDDTPYSPGNVHDHDRGGPRHQAPSSKPRPAPGSS